LRPIYGLSGVNNVAGAEPDDDYYQKLTRGRMDPEVPVHI